MRKERKWGQFDRRSNTRYKHKLAGILHISCRAVALRTRFYVSMEICLSHRSALPFGTSLATHWATLTPKFFRLTSKTTYTSSVCESQKLSNSLKNSRVRRKLQFWTLFHSSPSNAHYTTTAIIVAAVMRRAYNIVSGWLTNLRIVWSISSIST